MGQIEQPPSQNYLRPGVIELGFGEPDPSLLPRAEVAEACRKALAAAGDGALGYGAGEGPALLRELLAARGAREAQLAPAGGRGRGPGTDEIMITGGNSQALDLCVRLLAKPGDVVFVEALTYNLALGILRDCPVEVVPLPFDGEGLVVDGLTAACAEVRARRRVPRLLYTIPTFHNPTGVCLAGERRRALVSVAAAEGVTVLEDDVYRELPLGPAGGADAGAAAAPPALWSLSGPGPVVRLSSFSKTLAPGLRVGWLTADAQVVKQLAHSGLLESGGAVSQFAAHVVARLLEGELYERHLADVRAAYASRRDALCAALREHLPRDAGFGFAEPAGGFFVWLTLPAGLPAATLLRYAEAEEVSFFAGDSFSVRGGGGPGGEAAPAAAQARHAARLAFSLYAPEILAEGGRRLGRAARKALAATPGAGSNGDLERARLEHSSRHPPVSFEMAGRPYSRYRRPPPIVVGSDVPRRRITGKGKATWTTSLCNAIAHG